MFFIKCSVDWTKPCAVLNKIILMIIWKSAIPVKHNCFLVPMKTWRFITAGINLTDALSMQSIDYIFSLAEVSHKLQLLGFFSAKHKKIKLIY